MRENILRYHKRSERKETLEIDFIQRQENARTNNKNL